MAYKGIDYRAHNGYDAQLASLEAMLPAGEVGESLTVQSQVPDTDLNVLMERFGVTGKFPENPRVPTYGDFLEVKDFRSALDAVRKAQEGFAELPARLRARFENDPQQLLDFVADDRNIEEARSLGLLKERVHGVGVGGEAGPAAGGQGGVPAGAPVSGSADGSGGSGGAAGAKRGGTVGGG